MKTNHIKRYARNTLFKTPSSSATYSSSKSTPEPCLDDKTEISHRQKRKKNKKIKNLESYHLEALHYFLLRVDSINVIQCHF